MTLWSKAKLYYTVALPVPWYLTFVLYTCQLKIQALIMFLEMSKQKYSTPALKHLVFFPAAHRCMLKYIVSTSFFITLLVADLIDTYSIWYLCCLLALALITLKKKKKIIKKCPANNLEYIYKLLEIVWHSLAWLKSTRDHGENCEVQMAIYYCSRILSLYIYTE